MRAAAALLLLLLLPSGLADAKTKAKPKVKVTTTTYTDARTGFQLDVPEGWQQVTMADADDPAAPLAVFANDQTDQMIVVSKIPGVTDGAYDGDAAFFAALEAGIGKSAAAYKKLDGKQHKIVRKGKKAVPAYDLWFKMEREGATVTVGARYLFFKGYTLSLLIDSPTKKTDKGARTIAASFVPAP